MATRVIARTPAQLQQAFERLSEEAVLGVDTETTGLDPHTDTIHSVQISTEDKSFSVLVPRTSSLDDCPNLGPLLGLLNSHGVLKVAHNAIFDLKMLISHYEKFAPVRWYCSMVAERVLTAGQYKRTSLADVSQRYLGIERSKDIRTTFYDGTWDGFTWTDDLVDYAMEDVETLGPIMRAQVKRMKQEGLVEVCRLEMDLLPVWARMELRGITYEPVGGREFADDMEREARRLELELQTELQPFWEFIAHAKYQQELAAWEAWSTEWEVIKSETSKRKGLTEAQIGAQKLRRAVHNQNRPKHGKPTPPDAINVGSPVQLLPVLRATGLVLDNTKKEVLEELQGANQYIDLLLDWRMYSKMAGTFGEPLLAAINPKTHRVHCSFNPCVSTGRCSCYDPNLQQVPTRTDTGKRLRKLFIAGQGKKLVVADYSGIELVIIGVLSKDPNLLQAINENKDLHCWTIAGALGRAIPLGISAYQTLVAVKDGEGTPDDFENIKLMREYLSTIAKIPQLEQKGWDEKGLFAWVKSLRDYFKTITYGTAYGLSKFGLSRRLHFDLDAAEALIELFFSIYPAIRSKLLAWGENALNDGYSKTPIGRKRYFRHPYPVTAERIYDKMVELRKGYEKRDEEVPPQHALQFQARRELEREYNSRIQTIKRQGGNAPIQGCSADITKRAMLYASRAFEACGFRDDEGLLLPVHDELIAECDADKAETMAGVLKAQMERAALEILQEYVPDIRIVVSPVISDYWTH